jgi:type II secretory pathway pseudopilin PulG
LKSLYLRVWLSIVALLALFALVSTLLFKREVDTQRRQVVAVATTERLQAMGGLIENALPPASASEQEQASAVRDWSRRLRVPLALDDANGQRVEATRSFARRTARADADGPGHPFRLTCAATNPWVACRCVACFRWRRAQVW